MSSTQMLAFLVALVDLAFSGLISNGFIVTVIITEWATSRSCASSEQLLLSLGVSNIVGTAAVAAASLIKIYSANNFVNNIVLQVIYFCVVFCTFFRFWVAAWLSFFYCIKIVNSSHSFFLWCKLRISWLIPRLLLGSLVISLAASVFTFQNIFIQHLSNTTAKMMNMSQNTIVLNFPLSFKIFILVVGCGWPLLVVLFCSILVVASLYRHVCRMTGEESSFRSLQTKVHIKAAGTILSLLFLYVSFCIAQTLIMITDKRGLKYILGTVIKMMHPPAQAAILILVNAKLKQAATQMIQRPAALRCIHL